jgi:methyl coenzyme M reductase subunit C
MVSRKVVALTRRVFSFTIANALVACAEPPSIEELSEKGLNVRKVASTNDDQNETNTAANRAM